MPVVTFDVLQNITIYNKIGYETISIFCYSQGTLWFYLSNGQTGYWNHIKIKSLQIISMCFVSHVLPKVTFVYFSLFSWCSDFRFILMWYYARVSQHVNLYSSVLFAF